MKKKLFKASLFLVVALLLVLCFVSCDKENEESETVWIEFDIGRGAEFADEDFEGEIEIDKGTALEEFPEAIKEGYELEGWYFDEDFEDECDLDYEFEEDTVLFANWVEAEPVPTVTVKFDTSRAGNSIKLPNQEVPVGGKVTAPDYTPTKKGNKFYGWCVGGDKNKVWDFNKSTVTTSITLVAVFVSDGSGSSSTCEHNFEIIEYVEATCQQNGKIVQKCTICRIQQRLGPADDPTLARKEHLTLEENVPPTCALDGYIRIYCPNGCGLTDTFVLKATGKHEYDDTRWYAAIQPTKYVNGVYENVCVVCGGAALKESAPYTALDSELAIPQISYLYTGGKYVNEKFVNVAPHGRIEVSSFFVSTSNANINDGDALSFWTADTYVDGADYTADWFLIEFMKEYEIGALRFVLPNYTAWELGEGCYVSYDLEYWDSENEKWEYIGEVSDKDATSIGMSCELMLELDAPITTSKVRARVTHASRYAPAMVYELETYAKAAGTQRIPVAIHTEATASISGKYNEWVNGAGALVDNSTVTGWTADANKNPNPWAILEFPVEKFIACVQISTNALTNRVMALDIYENGEWVEFTELTIPSKGVLGNGVITNANGVCTFNVDIERNTSKIRLRIVSEPEWWNCVVYDIIPYSIVEKAAGEMNIMECTHRNPLAGEVVPPTCDTTGYTVMKCACGFETRTAAVDMLGHDFGKYSISTPATATALGTKTASCRHDGCTATSTITYEENYERPVITPYLHNAPAAWAQTLDDGNYVEAYTWGNEHFAKYGARATVMMSITYADALVSVWQEHFEKGIFDLGSHSYNHSSVYSAALSEGTLLHEVVDAQYWFRHNFKGQALLGFAAPLGATSEAVAAYLTGPLAANRNGGDTNIMFNTPDQLTSRTIWGDLNSYISKADQTEGIYVYVHKDGGAYIEHVTEIPRVDKDGNPVLDKDKNPIIDVTKEYEWSADINKGNKGPALLLNAYGEYVTAETPSSNYVFDEGQMTFVDKGYTAGTYVYVESDYRYDFYTTGSYNLVDGKFEFVDSNDGEYKLLKTSIGTYEVGVEQLVSVGGFTVECLHTIAQSSNVIYTKYEPTISKLEHLKRFGVWAASYNDLIKYLKEAQHADVQITEKTDSTIKVSVTDNLDNYMFNQAVTVKVDIPDSWTNVTVMQNGKEIPLVSMEFYKQTKNMYTVSCAIEEGYLYVDVVPDAGEVVITLGEKNDGVADYEEKVTVTFEPGEGTLDRFEYEINTLPGSTIAKYPVPVRATYKFTGWYLDEDCTKRIAPEFVFNTDKTLYAGWVEIPKCSDGTYDHNWNAWMEDSTKTYRTCKSCSAVEYDYDSMGGVTSDDSEGGITEDNQGTTEDNENQTPQEDMKGGEAQGTLFVDGYGELNAEELRELYAGNDELSEEQKKLIKEYLDSLQ